MQGGRFPWSAAAMPGAASSAYEMRLGVSVSPTDVLRGVRMEGSADAECELRLAADTLGDLVKTAEDRTTLGAFRAQARYLEEHRPEWRESLALAEKRLSMGLITAVELYDVRRLAVALDRKLEHARGEVRRLEAVARGTPDETLHAASQRYVRTAMEAEQSASAVQALEPYQLKFSAGAVAAPQQPLGWYGLLEVSYSLGSVSHGRAARSREEARARDLRDDPGELPARASVLAGSLRAEMASALEQLEALDRESAWLTSTLATFEVSRTARVDQARGVLGVEVLTLEAERVYLRALLDAQAALVTPVSELH
jgi:hypothetical protein